jgi:hypothetical protein
MPRLIPPPVRENRGYVTPCLIWRGRPSAQGYGRTTVDGEVRPAHVAAWEKKNGPVPDGHEIDHLCYQRMCVDLEHLECVTGAENRRRAAQRRHDGATDAERSAAARHRVEVRRANGTLRDDAMHEEIRRLLDAGATTREIQESVGCSAMTVSRVRNRG